MFISIKTGTWELKSDGMNWTENKHPVLINPEYIAHIELFSGDGFAFTHIQTKHHSYGTLLSPEEIVQLIQDEVNSRKAE